MSERLSKAVRVDWIDSMGQSGWSQYDDKTNMACTSYGHLIESTKEKVVIAMNKSAYGYGDYMTIPRSAVKKVKVVK